MIKAILVFFAGAVITLLVSSVNAMQINLSLGDDIKNNQDPLNISYNIYHATGPGPFDRGEQSQNIQGLMYQRIFDFFNAFNKAFADINPIDNYDGRHSQVTLGFKKNGADVYPTSCQNIKLQDTTNITLTETGCAVS